METKLNLMSDEEKTAQIFMNYRSSIDGVEKDSDEFKSLTINKNKLIRAVANEQIRKTGKFKIEPPDNACPDCHGTGERYSVNRNSITEPCNKCYKDKNGKPTGWFAKTCKSCKGEGRYKIKEDGLTINVECKYCHREDGKPTGLRLVQCRACQGTGEVTRNPIVNLKEPSPKEDSAFCETCNGTGFKNKTNFKRKTKDTFGTSVLNQELANVLKEILVEAK